MILVFGSFNLTGPGGSGVTAAGVRILRKATGLQLLIKRSTVSGFGVGVADAASGISIEGGIFSNNAGDGILVSNARDVVIDNVTSQDNGGSGIELSGVDGSTVEGQTAMSANVGYGLWLRSSSNNQTYTVQAVNDDLTGFYLGCSAKAPSDKRCPPGSFPSNDNNIVAAFVAANGDAGIEIDLGDSNNLVSASYGQDDPGGDAVDGNPNCDDNTWTATKVPDRWLELHPLSWPVDRKLV